MLYSMAGHAKIEQPAMTVSSNCWTGLKCMVEAVRLMDDCLDEAGVSIRRPLSSNIVSITLMKDTIHAFFLAIFLNTTLIVYYASSLVWLRSA